MSVVVSEQMQEKLSGLSKEEKIKKIQEELTRHDQAYADLEQDLELVKGDYTKELIRSHILLVIDNVIYLKELLEEIEKL